MCFISFRIVQHKIFPESYKLEVPELYVQIAEIDFRMSILTLQIKMFGGTSLRK